MKNDTDFIENNFDELLKRHKRRLLTYSQSVKIMKMDYNEALKSHISILDEFELENKLNQNFNELVNRKKREKVVNSNLNLSYKKMKYEQAKKEIIGLIDFNNYNHKWVYYAVAASVVFLISLSLLINNSNYIGNKEVLITEKNDTNHKPESYNIMKPDIKSEKFIAVYDDEKTFPDFIIKSPEYFGIASSKQDTVFTDTQFILKILEDSDYKFRIKNGKIISDINFLKINNEKISYRIVIEKYINKVKFYIISEEKIEKTYNNELKQNLKSFINYFDERFNKFKEEIE